MQLPLGHLTSHCADATKVQHHQHHHKTSFHYITVHYLLQILFRQAREKMKLSCSQDYNIMVNISIKPRTVGRHFDVILSADTSQKYGTVSPPTSDR